MALALYRTYRPGSLAEVIGQEHVTDPLARALDAGRTHHAYLFSGPRGCGKTSTARIIARSLNCEQGPTATPCGTCRSCAELAPNGPGSIDVVELDAATHRGIDDARELREKAIYAPAASRFKIYIIDEAHQLTNEAANALLKLVEEPPPHLRFIFATTEPDKIIPTIRSRTFHYGFRLVPARVLAEHLAGVCAAEGVPAEGPALAVVARAGAGSVRDSLSVLGQLLAGAGPEGLTYADAVSALGLTDASLIDAFVGALSRGSAAEMFGVVDEVISAGHDPRRFVTDVLERLRDLIIVRADHGALESGLVDVPDDAGERLLAQAESLSLAELSRSADLVSAGLSEVKGATAPRLQLELLCARLALPAVGDDHVSLVTRLERLERALASGGGTGGPGAPAPAAAARLRPGSAVPPLPRRRRRSVRVRSRRWAPRSRPARRHRPPGRRRHRRGGPPCAARTPPPSRRPRARRRPAGRPPRHRRPGRRLRPGIRVPRGSRPRLLRRPMRPAWSPSRAPRPRHPRHRLRHPQHPRPRQHPRHRPPPVRVEPGAPPPGTSPPSGRAGSRCWPGWPATPRVAWTAFHAAAPISLTGGVLAVAVAEPGHVRAIAQRGHDERLRQAIIDALGLDVRIDVLHDPDAAGGGRAAAPSAPAPASDAAASRPQRQGASPGATGAASPGGGPSQGARGSDLVRAAAGAGAQADPEPADEPSEDDPDLDSSGGGGLALITRELGARPIGEIDHS